MDAFYAQMEEAIGLEEGTLAADTEFKELEEWDSLALLTVLVMLQDEYGVTVSNAEVRGITTVVELQDLVTAKQSAA
ncbi:MAG: acyl carrier protein [Propionicimonas sp.]